MKITSELFDTRISAKNILIEISIGEYEDLVKEIVNKNEFQRKRVNSSKTVYALLKEDLLINCIIPPIVLALTSNTNNQTADNSDLVKTILDNKDNLLILDGLQRTHTILDLINELRNKNDENSLNKLLLNKIRIEIYIGLNRIGILYRMLTLNTGQTPMSLRQQIEMLYLDYLEEHIEEVELIRESDNTIANQPHQYNFKDVIEGFNAYLDRDELPIDKANILENISSLEKLSKENQNTELFEKYIKSFHAFIKKMNIECDEEELSSAYISLNSTPFGKNINQIFKKPQSLSGFGAAIGKLIDFRIVKTIDDIPNIINGLNIKSPSDFLEEINNSLFWLKNNSKKIGNAQRSFFAFFFRDLLNENSDTFQDPIESAKSALRKYQSQNM